MQAQASTITVNRPAKPATFLIILATLAAIAVGVIALASKGETTTESVTLGPVDAGSAVALEVGGELTVTLPANPSTGYTWVVTAANPTLLTQIGEPEFSGDSNLVGAGGTMTFRFEGTAVGQDSLQLDYLRPWEDAEPLETYLVTVTVR
jgi:inhibitor of cysteine peptidase